MQPKQELLKHTQAEDNIISLEIFSSDPDSQFPPLYSHSYFLSRMFMQSTRAPFQFSALQAH